MHTNQQKHKRLNGQQFRLKAIAKQALLMSMFQQAAYSCDFDTFKIEIVDADQPATISDFVPAAKHRMGSALFSELRVGEKLEWMFVHGQTSYQDEDGSTPPQIKTWFEDVNCDIEVRPALELFGMQVKLKNSLNVGDNVQFSEEQYILELPIIGYPGPKATIVTLDEDKRGPANIKQILGANGEWLYDTLEIEGQSRHGPSVAERVNDFMYALQFPFTSDQTVRERKQMRGVISIISSEGASQLSCARVFQLNKPIIIGQPQINENGQGNQFLEQIESKLAQNESNSLGTLKTSGADFIFPYVSDEAAVSEKVQEFQQTYIDGVILSDVGEDFLRLTNSADQSGSTTTYGTRRMLDANSGEELAGMWKIPLTVVNETWCAIVEVVSACMSPHQISEQFTETTQVNVADFVGKSDPLIDYSTIVGIVEHDSPYCTNGLDIKIGGVRNGVNLAYKDQDQPEEDFLSQIAIQNGMLQINMKAFYYVEHAETIKVVLNVSVNGEHGKRGVIKTVIVPFKVSSPCVLDTIQAMDKLNTWIESRLTNVMPFKLGQTYDPISLTEVLAAGFLPKSYSDYEGNLECDDLKIIAKQLSEVYQAQAADDESPPVLLRQSVLEQKGQSFDELKGESLAENSLPLGIDTSMNMKIRIEEPVIPGMWNVLLGIDNFPTTAPNALITYINVAFQIGCKENQEVRRAGCVAKSDEPEDPENREDPENPENREDPENPEDPEDPAEPEKPLEPENPEEGEEGEEEAKPDVVKPVVVVKPDTEKPSDPNSVEDNSKLFDEMVDLLEIGAIEVITIDNKLKKTTVTLPDEFENIGTGDLEDFELNVGRVIPQQLRNYVKVTDGQLVILPISTEIERSALINLILIHGSLKEIKSYDIIFTEVAEESETFILDFDDRERDDQIGEKEENYEIEAQESENFQEDRKDFEDRKDRDYDEDRDYEYEDDDKKDYVEEDTVSEEVDIEELGDSKLNVTDIDSNPKLMRDLFNSGGLADVPDSRKQEVLDQIMVKRIQVRKQKEGRDESRGVRGPPPQPKLAFQPADNTGALVMAFNSNMAGLEFINEIGVEISTQGKVSEQFVGDADLDEPVRKPGAQKKPRKLGAEMKIGFDLSQYMAFELRRGDEDSADPKDLTFEVLIDALEGDNLKFKMRFDKPHQVSKGSVPDQIIGTIINSDFFSASDSSKGIKVGTKVRTVLPRMLPGDEAVQVLAKTETAANSATSSLMTSQIIVTLALSVSLKQMWNLFCVMQVLGYAQNYAQWPAIGDSVINQIIDAIYLKKVNDALMDMGKSKFDLADDTVKDEYLQQQGIKDNSIMKSLGIFFVGVAIILIAILIYVLCKKFPAKCGSICNKIKNLIQKKLFYSGPLRYVIVSYLKLQNQFFNMLCIALLSGAAFYLPIAYGFLVVLLIVWPLWTLYFMIGARKKLGQPKHLEKFGSLYKGIKTNSFKALAYNAVFAVRRFDLVLVNVFFTAGSPLSGIERTWYLQKILCFLIIQIMYLSYIHITRPHEQGLFNLLEFVNEYALMGMAYLMINFTTIVAIRDSKTNELLPSSERLNTTVERLAILMIICITVINFGIMVRLSVQKIILSCKRKKMQKLHASQMASRKSNMTKSECVESEKPEAKSEKYEDSDVEASQIKIDESQKTAAATQKPKKKVKLNRFNREKKADRRYDALFKSEQSGLFQHYQTNVTNNVNININITNTNDNGEQSNDAKPRDRTQYAFSDAEKKILNATQNALIYELNEDKE